MLSLQQATRRYPGIRIGPLDLVARRGQTTVLVGPSGCGKSTALRMMIGLVAMDAGQVQVGGERLTTGNLRALRQRMGYVIQEGGLFPHLSATDNVQLMARHVGWDAARCDRRLGELAELVRLPRTLLSRFPAELSGGQRQRVSLMRALMLDPEVLLLDEPLGSLDPITRHDLQTELRDMFAALGKTVILVTHDMGEAAWFADTLILLRAGRIVQTGSLSDFINTPVDEFVTRFLFAQRSPTDALEHS